MAALSRRFHPVKDTVRAKESDHAQAKDGGGERHLLAGQASGFDYTSYIRFDPNWTNVHKIIRADLVLITETDAHVGFPTANAGIKVFRLAQSFGDPNDAEPEGAFLSRYPVVPKDPDSAAAGTAEGGEATLSRVIITGLVEDMAPKSVRRRNGKPGGGKTHHGFAIQRRTTTQQSNPRMCVGGMKHPDTTKRPYIELFYDPEKSDNSVTTVTPTGDVFSVNDTDFTGTFERGANQPSEAAPSKWFIELYKGSGSNVIWSYEGQATPSDVQSLTCTVPLSLVATTGSRYRFVSGTGYEWRLRAKSNAGDLTAWSGRRAFGIETNPPVLSDLRPGLTPALDTLNNVLFSAAYSDPDDNPLLRYQVQVRTQTATTDPAWGADLLWDSGPIDGSGFAPRTPGQATEIEQPYGGTGLELGLYSWRMRAWDVLNAESAWVYSDFELLKGWEPEPGEVDLLTGYVNRRLKARILIKGLSNHKQLLLKTGNPDGGKFKLTYDGDTTALIPHDANAGEVKSALQALSTISAGEIGVTKSGEHWTVTFDANHTNRPKITAGHYVNFASDERIDVYSDRAPGVPIAIIEDAANVGASEMYNAGGEFFFSIPAIHPQAAVIEPYQVHYALEVFRGESWREIAAGYITDYDATDNDVVFYGQDYMAILARQVDERFNKRAAADAEAKLWPASGGGSKYVGKTIKQIITDQLDRSIHDIGSPLAFFTRANVPALTDEVSIFVSFKERLPFIAGLIESWRAGKGIRTRVYAQRLGEGRYQWRVKAEPGRDRPNLRMEYGGLVQGFRIIPFGDFSTRLNAIGRLYNSSMLEYYIAKAPHPHGEDKGFFEERYGRFARATTYEDISDTSDLGRRARQQATRMTRIGKALALNLRPGSFSIKDGWDITDAVLVDIDRGVVDTRRMGSGYWTIWGWTWELKPDGQELITLSVLPKEDTHDADEDLIPSKPTPPGDGTGGGGGGSDHGPPDDDTPGDHYCDEDTGKCYHKCLDGSGKWCPDDAVPGTVAKLGITSGHEDTADRPIEMEVPDGADVAGRDLLITLSIDDASTEGSELAIPVLARYLGEATGPGADPDEVGAWTFTASGLSMSIYEAIGPGNGGSGSGGCSAPDALWSGWTHREGWVRIIMPFLPEGVSALRVDLPDLFGAPIGVGATELFGVRYSTTPPVEERSGMLLGTFTYPTVPALDIPVEHLPTAGGDIYIGISPEWMAVRDGGVCGIQPPATTGAGNSGQASYQPITISTKWVFGTPGAGESWMATMEEALPGAKLIEEASGTVPGLMHLVYRYKIKAEDFPAEGAIISLDPPADTYVPPPSEWDPETPPPPPGFPEPEEPEAPDWWDGLTPIPDERMMRWIIALYEGVTDIAANSVAQTDVADAPLLDPPWLVSPPAIWVISHSTVGTLVGSPAGYSIEAFDIVGDGDTIHAERFQPTLSDPFDPPPFGAGGTPSFTANIVLGHLPYAGQDFSHAFVGFGDGIADTFQGFPTVPGTAKWYVDGILVKPDAYDDATGIVTFDRPPAWAAEITQDGTKAKGS